MAVITKLGIISEDAQHYQDTLEFRIAPLAFAAAQTVPTPTEINAVINSIFGADSVPSTNRVLGYYVKIEQTAADLGGAGIAATSEAARVRNDPDGVPGNWIFRIPGLNKAAVSFDSSNPNSISTTGAMWDAVRTALAAAHIAVSDPLGAYSATPEDEIAKTAQAVDGRRAPMRPR